MTEIKVEVRYGNPPYSVLIDGDPLDLWAVEERPLAEWFRPTNDRSGWMGLIEEIRNFAVDQDTHLSFAFEGSEADKTVFFACVKEAGLDVSELVETDLGEDYFRKAEREKILGNLSEVFRCLQRAAEHGYVDAQYQLAECYAQGTGTDKSAEQAVKWYRAAAEQGHMEAQYQLAECYDTGTGIPEDKKEAENWYRKAVEQGHTKAQDKISMCFTKLKISEGNNKTKDHVIAKRMDKITEDKKELAERYRADAEQGDAEAQYQLAQCYYKGEGVSESIGTAVIWYRKAAEQNHVEAKYRLAECYELGVGMPVNRKQAVKWYREAAEQGYGAAQYDLGRCYAEGIGVARNLQKAKQWYRTAVRQGHEEAQCALEEIEFGDESCTNMGNEVLENDSWDDTDNEVPEDVEDMDDEEMMQWYHTAARKGDPEAQYNLALFYYDGSFGVSADVDEAVYWWHRSAEQGHSAAQSRLADCYSNGIGVSKDMEEAIYWQRKAAEQGHATAQYNLGVCYYDGIGVRKDAKQAVHWFHQSAEQEDEDAQFALGACYEFGIGVRKDVKQAVEWYRKAAEQGNADAAKAVKRLSKRGLWR